MFDFGWLDTHCHLTDERIFSNLEKEISAAQDVGISGFIASVLSFDEFEMMKLPEFDRFRKFINWSAGIHPFYEKSSETDFDALVQLCDEKRIIAVGEIGLDKRKDNFAWQKNILKKQLDLAKNYHLPVIFHIVKQHYEVYKIIKKDFPQIFGFVHGFGASKEIFDLFSKFDLGFSINLHPPKPEVMKLIVKRGFFFLETDAPYQKAKNSQEEFNRLKNLPEVAENISRITGIGTNELKKKQFANFKMLF